jgi:hypothetical protein
MSGKPCIHCGAHVNYFSGSNCDVGHLHRACWKAFHSTPIPETESPKHQQRSDEESGWTDAHDKELSNRGTSVSTHSEGGDATDIDEQTEPAFEDTEAVAEERTKKWRRIALKAILIGVFLFVATSIAFSLVSAGYRSTGTDWVDKLIGLWVVLLLVIWATISSKKWGSGASVGIGLIVVALIVVGGVILYFLKAFLDLVS